MLDQGPPCFGHLAKSLFLVNMMVLAKLNFQDDLDKLTYFLVNFRFFLLFSLLQACPVAHVGQPNLTQNQSQPDLTFLFSGQKCPSCANAPKMHFGYFVLRKYPFLEVKK